METIKDYLIIIMKETMKFVLFGISLFFLVGLSVSYVLIEILKIDMEISAIIAGAIAAITIVVFDDKKVHAVHKVNDAYFKILKRILKKEM